MRKDPAISKTVRMIGMRGGPDRQRGRTGLVLVDVRHSVNTARRNWEVSG